MSTMLKFVVLLVLQQYSSAQTALCTDARTKVEAKLKEMPGLVGLEIPVCEPDGTYRGIQFIGSQAKCVTAEGAELKDYVVNRGEVGDDLNCQCARDQNEYQKSNLIGKTFSCEQDGSYSAIGCMGSVCFCQDSQGNQVGTSTVSIGQQGSLNCQLSEEPVLEANILTAN